MGQRIEFVSQQIESVFIEHKDRFCFSPQRKFVLLQRLCFWFLRKVRAYACDDVKTLKRVVLDKDDIVNTILKQRMDLVNRYDRDGFVVLMGSVDAGDFHFAMNCSVGVSAGYHWCGRSGEASFHHMRVIIVPHMQGVLVVPRDILRPDKEAF